MEGMESIPLLKDKNILIMGLRNRWSIAWAIAQYAKEAGATLYLTYQGEREAKNAVKLADQLGGAEIISCNVAVDEEIQGVRRFLEEKQVKLDGYVHSIAHALKQDMQADFIETCREGFAHAMDVSAYSLVACCRELKDLMNPGCSILTLTYMGSEKVFPGYNVMGVAKAALEASVRYLAYDLGTLNIRVNAISAGPIKTLAAGGIKSFRDLQDAAAQRAPIKEPLVKEEVGQTALYLLSGLSCAVTGEVIHVDKGYNILGI